MTTPLSIVITDAGRTALVDAEGGGTAAVVIAEVGVTASVFVAAPTLAALPGEIKRIDTIAGVAADADTVHLIVRDSSDEEYVARGIALYLDDGTLFAAYSQPDPILGKYAASHFLTAIDLKFLDGEAELIEFGDTNFLNPPATEVEKGVAYLATVIEALAGAVTDKIITPATMAAVLANYVAADQLGVVNGVATLGADGKLAIAQRPPIDLIDVWPVVNEAAMLALGAATVGDFAVRADNGLIYVLQDTPAATLANWLEISTPAPVSSVNGKVGTVVLTPADVGAVPTARTITGAGLLAGQGGNLGANRTFTIDIATAAETLAGVLHNKALTPASLADLITALNAKASGGATVSGGGLVTGGGAISGNPALTVTAANAAEILTGAASDKVVTPAGLGGLAKSLTPNGYVTLSNGLIIQWVAYRSVILSEVAIPVSWPIVFPGGVLSGSATAWLATPSTARNLWAQIVAQTEYGCSIQLQRDAAVDQRVDGFDVIMFGF
ncbi:gp53-like domain-containing protein [Sphingomonas sp. LT1P40]|uniref:gp53-like domain-containing protein n=1 Tax=Alteristakelama amylovorans TaxID=3096166 RepID=UPI002FCA1915